MPEVTLNILIFAALVPVFPFLVWVSWKARSLLEHNLLEYVWVALVFLALASGFGLVYFGAQILGIWPEGWN